MNPRLIIDLGKLRHNAGALAEACRRRGIAVAAVTKVFCAEREMVEALAALPIEYMADSRIENIRAYPRGPAQRTMLLRLPSVSEAEAVVRHCDMSLNSEVAALEALADAARRLGKVHGVVLMIDLGDLREGVYHSDTAKIHAAVEFILARKSLLLEGFGTNLTCYGSVLPTRENLGRLVEIAEGIRQKFGVAAPMISGGNSSSLVMLAKGELPAGVNNLRLGESIVCGKETAYGEVFEGLLPDVVILEAEIIEIAEKPSHPEGEININAFGEKMTYVDKGVRKRAILAVGRQDTDYEGLTCLSSGIEIVGASSDHLIVDITDSETQLMIGGRLTFSLSYGGVLAGFTSRYVDKHYINGL